MGNIKDTEELLKEIIIKKCISLTSFNWQLFPSQRACSIKTWQVLSSRKRIKRIFKRWLPDQHHKKLLSLIKKWDIKGGGITEFPVLHNYQRGQNVLQGVTNQGSLQAEECCGCSLKLRSSRYAQNKISQYPTWWTKSLQKKWKEG